MDNFIRNIDIRVNGKIFLKDPESSELGKRIVSGSIDLISEIGFDAFTFRKLALKIGTTEASVYRYFESKHRLLLYLFSWYWAWMEYKLAFATANVESASDRLKRAIRLLTEEVLEDGQIEHINEVKLHKILIAESSKVYLTQSVDQENKEGVFVTYKRLVERISDIIIEMNPDYRYPHMLVSTLLEGAHHQRFFAEHLPRLTDNVHGEDAVVAFSVATIFKVLEPK